MKQLKSLMLRRRDRSPAVGEVLGLLGRVIENIFTRLPSVLIAWKYPPEKVAQSFFIELGSPRGVQVVLQGPSSRVMLYLRAINLGPLPVETERFDLSVAVGNQPLYSGQIFKRRRIAGFSAFPEFGYGHRGWGTDSLYFDIPVDSGRAAAITETMPKWSGPFDVQLRIQVYGRCKTGPIERTDISLAIPSGGAGIN